MRSRLGSTSLRAPSGALAVVLSVAASTAGWSFVWCAPMSEARLHCCCPSAPSGHDAVSRECCDDRSVPGLPGAELFESAPPAVLPAALAGVLPLDVWLGAWARIDGALTETDVEARAGPDQRLHAAHSVYLI
jgi:hypothetical protein